ncbi:MAG: IPT/TIG domain-containing protein [Bacteroidota bacterium]|jgi:hypothetical protein
MKRFVLLTLFLSISTAFFFSCSDNSTNNPTNNTNPTIASITPNVAYIGQDLIIRGKYFGNTRDSSYVELNGSKLEITNYISWSDSVITIKIPRTAITGQVVINVGTKKSNSVILTIKPNYFPFSVGSYWMFENFILNMDQSRDLTSRYVDSTFIEGTELKYGKDSYILAALVEGSTTAMLYNFYSDGPALYSTADYVFPREGATPITLVIPNDWVLIAHPDSTQWTINTQQINSTIDLGNLGSRPIKGTFKIYVQKGESKVLNFDYGIGDVNTQEYKIFYDFAGSINIGADIPVNFTLTQHNWYGENIGLMKTLMESKTITIKVLFTSYDYNIQGMESTILRYKIQ